MSLLLLCGRRPCPTHHALLSFGVGAERHEGVGVDTTRLLKARVPGSFPSLLLARPPPTSLLVPPGVSLFPAQVFRQPMISLLDPWPLHHGCLAVFCFLHYRTLRPILWCICQSLLYLSHALPILFLCLSRGPVSCQGPASLLYLSEAFPERLGGFRVDRLGEVCTVGEWLEVPGLRPLVARSARCRLPSRLTLAPGTPKLWVLSLPAPSVVSRTGELREGLAASAHWSLLPMGAVCPHRDPSFLCVSSDLLRARPCLMVCVCICQSLSPASCLPPPSPIMLLVGG